MARPLLSHQGPGAHAAVPAGAAPGRLAGHAAAGGAARPGRPAPVGLVHALHLRARPGACRPAPGNFLFAADGTVGVLDFGCTGALGRLSDTDGTRLVGAAAPAADPQRDALVLQAYQALGLAGPDLALATYSAELAPALADMQAWQLEPSPRPSSISASSRPPSRPRSTSACWGAIWRRCRARCRRSIACGWA